MVVVLETVARPMGSGRILSEWSQLPLWDSRLDYEHSSLALRLLAFGVVITCEGLYICSELAPLSNIPSSGAFFRSPTSEAATSPGKTA